MNITKKINALANAHEVMQRQAGRRVIVSFIINDEDGHTMTRSTSHYGNYDEVVAEWDKMIERYGAERVAIESTHGEAIAKHAQTITQ